MKLKQHGLKKGLVIGTGSALMSLLLAPLAQADVEVSASAGAANMYYWRGYDLGGDSGTPAVWGDLSVNAGGLYTGVWTSSGDESAGTEYDLFAGYGNSMGAFSYDVSVWTYAYPETDQAPGDNVEAIVGLGLGPVSAAYYHGMEDLEDYWYSTVGLDLGDFNFTYGLHEDDYAHFDISYGYNENLSFTLGLVVDDADMPDVSDEPKVVVGYSVPLK